MANEYIIVYAIDYIFLAITVFLVFFVLRLLLVDLIQIIIGDPLLKVVEITLFAGHNKHVYSFLVVSFIEFPEP